MNKDSNIVGESIPVEKTAVINYKGLSTAELKAMRKTPYDPNEGIVVKFFNNSKFRQQSVKRIKLIGMELLYNDIYGQRRRGWLSGFNSHGALVIACEDKNFPPVKEKANIVFVGSIR